MRKMFVDCRWKTHTVLVTQKMELSDCDDEVYILTPAELDERERKAIRFMVEWVSKHPTLIPKNVEALFEQYKKARGDE